MSFIAVSHFDVHTCNCLHHASLYASPVGGENWAVTSASEKARTLVQCRCQCTGASAGASAQVLVQEPVHCC